LTIFAFDEITGSQIAVSGIEAQIRILHYMMEDFELALGALRSAAGKIKDGIGKTTALFGMILNQIGLTLVVLGDIKQAAAVFEEAEDVFEQTSGADHLDTLDVCNNLAGTYDALGRYFYIHHRLPILNLVYFISHIGLYLITNHVPKNFPLLNHSLVLYLCTIHPYLISTSP
jgi:tetratricopeptide (TPR) repeat protein